MSKRIYKENNFIPHKIEWTPDKVAKLWNYYSQNPAYQNQYFSYQAGEIVLNYIYQYIRLNKMLSILDYGCGTGYLLNELLKSSKKEQKCFGLDFSKESVTKANQKYSENPNFGGAVWIERLPSPFVDESMDLVFSLDVIEHLDEKHFSVMMKEIIRLLKPNGYFVVTTLNNEYLDASKTICPDCGCVFHRWQHLRNWTCDTLKLEMEKAGFNRLHISETNFATKHQRLIKLFLKLIPKYKKNLIYIGRKYGNTVLS